MLVLFLNIVASFEIPNYSYVDTCWYRNVFPKPTLKNFEYKRYSSIKRIHNYKLENDELKYVYSSSKINTEHRFVIKDT